MIIEKAKNCLFKIVTIFLTFIIFFSCSDSPIDTASPDASSTIQASGAGAVNLIYVAADAVGSNNGTSWADAYVDLQTAINNASGNTSILVKEGVYYPVSWPNGGSELRERHFSLKPGITIVGGFDGSETAVDQSDPENNPTILSGDFNDDDIVTGSGSNLAFSNMEENAYTVIFTPDIFDGRATLQGLIIEGGYAERGNSFNDGMGAGLYSPGFFKLENCIFRYNYSENSAGAIYSHSYHSNDDYSGNQHQNILLNCSFIKNRSGDGSNGIGSGGAIYIYNYYTLDNPPQIDGCIFKDNRSYNEGGAVWIASRGSSIDNCVFQDNYGKSGGAVGIKSRTVINHSWFIDNSCSEVGGAVHSYSGMPIFMNCLFNGNHAANTGGAIYNGRSDAYVANCTIINNTTGSLTGGAMISYELSEQYVFNSIFIGNYGNSTTLNGIRATEGTETKVWNSIFDVSTNGSRVTMESGNTLSVDPSTVLETPNDPSGDDDVFGTSDDGWYLCTDSIGENVGNPLDSSAQVWADNDITNIIRDIIGVFDTDLVGNIRPAGSAIDIGAYEISE